MCLPLSLTLQLIPIQTELTLQDTGLLRDLGPMPQSSNVIMSLKTRCIDALLEKVLQAGETG